MTMIKTQFSPVQCDLVEPVSGYIAFCYNQSQDFHFIFVAYVNLDLTFAGKQFFCISIKLYSIILKCWTASLQPKSIEFCISIKHYSTIKFGQPPCSQSLLKVCSLIVCTQIETETPVSVSILRSIPLNLKAADRGWVAGCVTVNRMQVSSLSSYFICQYMGLLQGQVGF